MTRHAQTPEIPSGPPQTAPDAGKGTAAEKILRNRARCLKCDDIIESKHRHDFVNCKCGAIFVDGGLAYLRRGGDLDYFEELSE